MKILPRSLVYSLMIASVSALTVPSYAKQSYNQVSFDVQVSQTVANDELKATLTKTSEHAQAKTLANTLNSTANKALALAKKYPKVKATTGYQRTYPRYDDKGKIDGFRGSASINIQSQDFAQASDYIAELQGFMNLENLNFGVSEHAQTKTKETLKADAIKAFLNEAGTTSQAFGATGYKIVEVKLGKSDYTHPYAPAPLMMSAAYASNEVAPQEFEGGETELSYSVAGTIELTK